MKNRPKKEELSDLFDQPRSGRPTIIEEKTVKNGLKLTTERVPHKATHWSIVLMSEHAEMDTWQVRQTCKAADLKLHRIKTFKISKKRGKIMASLERPKIASPMNHMAH